MPMCIWHPYLPSSPWVTHTSRIISICVMSKEAKASGGNENVHECGDADVFGPINVCKEIGLLFLNVIKT